RTVVEQAVESLSKQLLHRRGVVPAGAPMLKSKRAQEIQERESK
ncbi:hypothetical protein A2U01_0089865, partial [Trifolium medium]|nr:hypothetical protein [Trifolium medium]